MKRGEHDYAYNAQAAVDGECGVIVAAALTDVAPDVGHPPALAGEVRALREVAEVSDDDPTTLSADAGYFSGENVGEDGAGLEGADVGHLGVELRIGRRRGQPGPNQVRLEIPLFSRRAAWRAEIRSTIPRRMISAASSVVLQWLIGRPDSPGASHASAIIRQTCSGLIRAGVPVRGPWASRAVRLNSATGTARPAHHCLRHFRTVSRWTPMVRATSLLLSPSAASNTIRARSASCCPVVGRRANRSNAARSAAVMSTGGSFGPGIAPSWPQRGTRFSHYRRFSAKAY